jgi:sodium transport system permease protein
MSVLALVRAVAGKELVDGLRDRRTLLMALAFPLLGPIVLTAAFSLVSREARSTEADGVRLPVVGREHAPALVAFLSEGRITIVDPPPDPEAAVRGGQAEAVLVIPPEFGARLRAGEPAPLRLIVDESRGASSATGLGPADRVLARLDGWARQTAAQRLILRGVHPLVVAPLAIERRDVSTSASRAAVLFSVMPYFLVMAIFIGGMAVAIDTTAGERERQSLEPLLANPVPRSALVLGKIAASSFFSLLALTETSIGFAVVPLLLPAEHSALAFRLDPGIVARIYVMCLPLLFAANALMILVAARARTFKAAQTTLSFLMMVPAAPGFVLAMSSVKAQPWMKAVPDTRDDLPTNYARASARSMELPYPASAGLAASPFRSRGHARPHASTSTVSRH